MVDDIVLMLLYVFQFVYSGKHTTITLAVDCKTSSMNMKSNPVSLFGSGIWQGRVVGRAGLQHEGLECQK